MRKKALVLGFAALAILFAVAGFSKPKDLRSAISDSGIQLVPLKPDEHRSRNAENADFYRTSVPDRARLISVLKANGFELLQSTESSTEPFWMDRSRTFLGLFDIGKFYQMVWVGPESKPEFKFEPRLDWKGS